MLPVERGEITGAAAELVLLTTRVGSIVWVGGDVSSTFAGKFLEIVADYTFGGAAWLLGGFRFDGYFEYCFYAVRQFFHGLNFYFCADFCAGFYRGWEA